MRSTDLFLAFLATSLAAAPAVAQTSAPQPSMNATVAGQGAVPDAPKPSAAAPEGDALTPIGARLGSFIFYPKIETSLTYNDNVYALANKTSDWVGRISPSATLKGDWGTATAAFRASLDRYEYFKQGAESRTDWSVGGNAQFEVQRDVLIYGGAGFSRAHEDRGDPNALTTDRRPTKYDLTELGGGFGSDATRLSYGVDVSYRHYNYYDNAQISGVIVNNDDRDRDQLRVAGRLGYEFSPGYRLLARGAYDNIDYSSNVDDAGFNRDSHGWRGTLGLNFELTRLLEGEVFAGYLNRSYKDVRFVDVNSFVFGSKLTWHPSELTTVRFNVDRAVQETVAANYKGFLSTNYSLDVRHELSRTVVLTAAVRYETDAYRRSSTIVAQRNDDLYGASVGVRYTINRNVYAGLAYDWDQRRSNVALPGTRYSRNKVAATLGLQF